MMKNLFSELKIENVQTNDYLQWKNNINSYNFNYSTSQKVKEFIPKSMSISNHHFKLHENFNHFGEIAINEQLNITEQVVKINLKFHDTNELNFEKTYINKFVAAAGSELGIYSLKYELLSCQPFSELTLNLKTAYASTHSPLNIYVSDDALSWTKIGTRTSDEAIYDFLDLSIFAERKKRIYLKFSYDKVKLSDSIYLTDLVIRGRAGQEDMNCKETPSNEKTNDTKNKKLISKSDKIITTMDKVDSPIIVLNRKTISLFDKGFDPNWQLNDEKKFNINYGFTAFLKNDDIQISQPVHGFQVIYRVLIIISFIFYMFLWLALIWIKIYPVRILQR
jgi:hypothetical protein